MPASARNCWKWLLFTLLPLAAGCYSDPGPPQVMLFKATPFPGADSQQVDLDQVQKVVSLRLRAARLARRVQVEPNGLSGLKVSVYGADEAALEQIQSYVTQWGQLEFAEVANPLDHRKFQEGAAADAERDVVVNGETVAAWLPVRRGPDGEPAAELRQPTDVIMRTREVDGKPRTELLVVYEPGYRITGDMLESAYEGLDSLGGPCIQFALNAEGAANMKSLTTALKPQGERTHKLAIIFDGEIYSAPRIMSPIGERGEITGQFTQNEVRQTVHVLRSGELPCQLTFEKMIDPPAK